jgi:RecA-family ATPase
VRSAGAVPSTIAAMIRRQEGKGGEQADVPFASIREQAGAPAAVVIDTLNRSLAGSESSDEDMAAYIKAADAIRDAFNCAVVIVHHCGHEGTRPRGHSSLMGALDAQVAVTKDQVKNMGIIYLTPSNFCARF